MIIKKILIYFILIFFSVIAALFLSEYIIREFILTKFLVNDIFQPAKYSEIVYEYKPNLVYNKPPYINLKFNSSGYRDEEFDEIKLKNRLKIICLGDSATFGHGIPKTENTLPDQLEKKLNSNGSKSFVVYNMGVQGYNARHELATLKYKALKLKPDMVLLMFNFGDFGYDWITVKQGKVSTALDFPPVAGKYLPKDINNWLLKNSSVYFFVELLLSQNVYTHKKWQKIVSKKTNNIFIKTPLGYELKTLLQFENICRKNKIKFILVMMPWFSFVIDSKSPEIKLLNNLKNDLEKNHIEYIDLFPTVLYENNKTALTPQQYTQSLKAGINDPHPNEKALEKYAETIKGYIKQNIPKN